jgi:hypothetical protein
MRSTQFAPTKTDIFAARPQRARSASAMGSRFRQTIQSCKLARKKVTKRDASDTTVFLKQNLYDKKTLRPFSFLTFSVECM